MRSKLTACLGGLLALCLSWMSWRHASPTPSHSQIQLPVVRVETPYSMPVVGNEAAFDLEFAPNDSYRLLISNFGTVDETARVAIEAVAVPAAVSFPGERMSPLPIRPLVAEAGDRTSTTNTAAARAVVELPIELPSEVHSVIPVGHAADTTERDFYMHVTDGALENPQSYVRVRAPVVVDGAHCRTYLDRQQPATPAILELAKELVRVFDEEVWPRSRATIGLHRDVDNDGKLALLLTPWLGKMQGGETTLKGFTRSSDFRAGIPAPFSNHCDVIYLHSQLRPGPMLRDLLAHEYAHAVSFSHRQTESPGGTGYPEEEDWINEGVAHLAENLAGTGWTNLDYRISRYLDAPAQSPLLVSDYYRSGLWRDHGCRGATYLFLRWCTDVWGDQLAAALIRSPSAGVNSLERLTGLSFTQLYRHFNVALATNGDPPTPAALVSDTGKSLRPLETVSLLSRLGSWQLAGPHWEAMTFDESPRKETREVSLKGTATSFVELRPGHAEGTQSFRIRIRGSSNSRLQITLIRCRPDAPSLSAQARWDLASDLTGDPRTAGATVELASRGAGPLEIEAVAFEQNVDETRRSVSGQILREAIPDHGPLSPDVPRTLRVMVPREQLAGASGPWSVKVVARTPHGRRVSAFTSLPEWQSTLTATAARDGDSVKR